MAALSSSSLPFFSDKCSPAAAMPAAIEKTLAPENEKQKAVKKALKLATVMDVKRETARIQALDSKFGHEQRLRWLKWDEAERRHAQAEAERRHTNELHTAEREAESIRRCNTPLTKLERQRAIGLLEEERRRRAKMGCLSHLTEPERQRVIARVEEDILQRAKMSAMTEPERQRAIDNLLSPFRPQKPGPLHPPASASEQQGDFKQRPKQDEDQEQEQQDEWLNPCQQ